MMDFCRPVGMRTTTLPPLPKRLPVSVQHAAAMGLLNAESCMARDMYRASRFGLMLPSGGVDHELPPAQTAALDNPYHPSKHGVRSIVKAKGGVRR